MAQAPTCCWQGVARHTNKDVQVGAQLGCHKARMDSDLLAELQDAAELGPCICLQFVPLLPLASLLLCAKGTPEHRCNDCCCQP